MNDAELELLNEKDLIGEECDPQDHLYAHPKDISDIKTTRSGDHIIEEQMNIEKSFEGLSLADPYPTKDFTIEKREKGSLTQIIYI